MDKANMPMVITYGSDLQANLVQAAKDGAFWDLNDFVWDKEKYPNLSQMNENVIKGFTVDGQLVGIYRSRPIGRNGLGYRADWAEKLGLDEPKTIEDVYNMMYQFTYGDPEETAKMIPTACAFANIQVRWISYRPGSAPETSGRKWTES